MINLIERLLCLEAEDIYLKNIFRLFERIYKEILVEKHI